MAGLCHIVRCIRCVHEPVSLLNLLHRIPKPPLQCGCHKKCPRGVPEAKQSCVHDLFGFFYRYRCHEHVSLLNLLHRIPEELSQSGCHKRCPRGVPEASEGGVEPTGGGGRGGGPPLHMKFSRDAAIPRIPAPHLLKQGQLQLAGASFRDLVFVGSMKDVCRPWHWIRNDLHSCSGLGGA